jgi:RNA polymerase sigma-70 factor, ECF subfamily
VDGNESRVLDAPTLIRVGPLHDCDPMVVVTVPQETTLQLLRLARDGDTRALDALFARYRARLQRWASGRLPRWARDVTDTQDLVQETLFQTFRKLESFEPRSEGALQAYVRQALLNRIRDEIRRANRRPSSEPLDFDWQDGAASPLEKAIGHQRLEQYEAALMRLKASDREVLIARLELGFDYDELARMLGKPTAQAARKTAERAVLRLAIEMKRAV